MHVPFLVDEINKILITGSSLKIQEANSLS